MSTPIEKIELDRGLYIDEYIIDLAEKINELIDVLNSKQDKPCPHDIVKWDLANGRMYAVCTACSVVIYGRLPFEDKGLDVGSEPRDTSLTWNKTE